MTIIPLRNLLLVRLKPEDPQKGSLIVIRDPKLARPAEVLAVGPDVRDLKVGDTALVNSISATLIGDALLVPETAVLGTL